jgi:hypothetical protein
MGLPNTYAEQIEVVNLRQGVFWLKNKDGVPTQVLIPPEHESDFADALIAYLKILGLSQLAAELTTQLDDRRADRAGADRQKETAVMAADKPATLADSAKTYAATVAYRTAAIQLTKRMRGVLADALTQHLKGKARASKRQMLLDLLDGPLGDPLVAALLSGLLPQAAGLIGQNGDKIGRLAEELRLHAGVAITSELVDGLFSLLGPAKDALTQALSGLPEVVGLQEPNGRAAIFDIEPERAKATA